MEMNAPLPAMIVSRPAFIALMELGRSGEESGFSGSVSGKMVAEESKVAEEIPKEPGSGKYSERYLQFSTRRLLLNYHFEIPVIFFNPFGQSTSKC